MDAGKVLKILREAAIHLRATKGRRGTVVYLDDADEVLVAGDLHGNVANLKKIVEHANLDQNPNRHLVLQEFIHGTVRFPNGGCTSHVLLDTVAMLKCRYPHRVHLLLGNHEMAQWQGRSIAKEGYSLNDLFEIGVEHSYAEHSVEILERYDELFAAMLLGVRTPNGVFMSHSVPDPKATEKFDPRLFDEPAIPESISDRQSSAYHLIWDRDTSETGTKLFTTKLGVKFLVNGHIAQKTGIFAPNSSRIILDCVASPAGCLLFSAQEPLEFDDLLNGVLLFE